MNRDEIVVLARESGFETEIFNSIDGDEVVVGYITITDLLVEFANLVAEKEREACAQLCENLSFNEQGPWHATAKHQRWLCSLAIRARGNE